jgi:hypothetical protein
MDEYDWANRFSEEVDALLGKEQRVDIAPKPAEYEQAFALASYLVKTDFSTESKVRDSLKRQLSQKTGKEEQVYRSTIYQLVLRFKQRPVAAFGTVALAILVVAGLFFGSRVATAAEGLVQEVYEGLRFIVLGENSAVEQVEPLEELPTSLEWTPPWTEHPGWLMKTDIGNFGGNLPPEVDATMRSYATLTEAQQFVSFPIRTPTWLPEGYGLREINVTPPAGPVSVFLFYSGPEADIIVVEQPLGIQSEDESAPAIDTETGATAITKTIEATGSRIVTDETVEEIEFDGRSAAWIGEYRLDWEDDGIGYTVGGLDLSLEQALHIARSLRTGN